MQWIHSITLKTPTFYQFTDSNKLNIMSVVAPAHGETINGAECPNK